MREMRLKKREITDPEILREILESCEVVRIGAMDEEGMCPRAIQLILKRAKSLILYPFANRSPTSFQPPLFPIISPDTSRSN